jgi:hypothetical protein
MKHRLEKKYSSLCCCSAININYQLFIEKANIHPRDKKIQLYTRSKPILGGIIMPKADNSSPIAYNTNKPKKKNRSIRVIFLLSLT